MGRFYSCPHAKAKTLLLALALVCACMVHAAPKKVILLALFEHKAIFQIDGVRRLLSAGQTSPEGVTLISADPEQAVAEIAGRREMFSLQTVANSIEGVSGEASSVPATTTLWADGSGFFHAEGSVDGTPVRFLVDTGANTVALNDGLARRIGIDYRSGRQGMVTTASGYARGYGVTLATVKIGGITVHNVAAVVIEGPQPATPLLGMSFLGRLEMRRAGDRMELTRRY